MDLFWALLGWLPSTTFEHGFVFVQICRECPPRSSKKATLNGISCWACFEHPCVLISKFPNTTTVVIPACLQHQGLLASCLSIGAKFVQTGDAQMTSKGPDGKLEWS